MTCRCVSRLQLTYNRLATGLQALQLTYNLGIKNIYKAVTRTARVATNFRSFSARRRPAVRKPYCRCIYIYIYIHIHNVCVCNVCTPYSMNSLFTPYSMNSVPPPPHPTPPPQRGGGASPSLPFGGVGGGVEWGAGYIIHRVGCK